MTGNVNGARSPLATSWLALLRVIVLGGALVFAIALTNGLENHFKGSTPAALGSVAGMVVVFGALYVGFSRFIERKPVRELDLAGGGREFGQGVLVGAGLYTLCVVVLMVLGIYRIEGFNSAAFLLPAITMALSSGIFEELLFRGVLHRSIEDVFGSWAALFVSALLFGLFHLFNPAGTLAGALFIAVEAGILLSAAFLLTGKLWMSMGFHISWNYTQSAIFSGIVSGGVADPGLIRANIVGPEALTGGSFGIEASWIALTVCTITGLTLLRGAVRRGNMRPPIWARPVAPAAA